MHRLTMLVTLVVSVFSFIAHAETYYVDKNHPQANNSNAGTTDLPWLTMQHAANTIQAGDTLLVKSGTYSGVFTISNLSGTSNNPTVVQTYPGEQVVLGDSGLTPDGLKLTVVII